jgi:large subunit ribosomal protein L25
MSKIEISAQLRDTEKESAKNLLEQGMVPGVVYGHGFENVPIKIGRKEFITAFNEAGESTLINLVVDGKEVGNVVVKDYQTDPVTDFITHFDLHKVKMTEKMSANVEIHFIGESPAVKNEGGVLVIGQDSIEIWCLPSDLISEIEIDLEKLEHVDQMIRVKDLAIPTAVEVLDEPENVIISVEPQRSESEMEDLEAKVEENVAAVEGAVKEEKPEGEGAEK